MHLRKRGVLDAVEVGQLDAEAALALRSATRCDAVRVARVAVAAAQLHGLLQEERDAGRIALIAQRP